MPYAAKSFCTEPGCDQLVSAGMCEDHKKEAEQRRGTAAQRGYGYAWRKLRDDYLSRYPYCALCGNRAVHVDHITAKKRGGSDDLTNLQPLCQRCHSVKTAEETPGGWHAK